MGEFPTNPGPDDGYATAKIVAGHLRLRCATFNEEAAVSDVDADRILLFRGALINDYETFNSIKTIDNIVAYVRDVTGDQGLDVVALFQDMIDAIEDALQWIFANFPTDSSGYIQARKITLTGVTTRDFPPGQTVNLRAYVQAIIDTIQEKTVWI